MRFSSCYIPTLKESPADAEVVSHKLLLRAGMVRRLTSGLYIYLPLGLKIIDKIADVVREEINAAGFQELAAGNSMTHKKSLFLSDSGLDRMKLPRRHKPKKEATESIRYLFVTAYSYQRVTNASITLNPCGVNRFWAQRRQFLHRQQRQLHR